jgi:hypothetical protein
MWNKILEINWKARFGSRDEDMGIDEPIEGTNGATLKKMKGVNKLIRLFLSAVEIPGELAIRTIPNYRLIWSSEA